MISIINSKETKKKGNEKQQQRITQALQNLN